MDKNGHNITKSAKRHSSAVSQVMVSVLTLTVIASFCLYFFFAPGSLPFQPDNAGRPVSQESTEEKDTTVNLQEVTTTAAEKDTADKQGKEALKYSKTETDTETGTDTETKTGADLTKSEIVMEDRNGGEIWALDRLKYTILVRNTGDSASGLVEVVCKVPPGMGYVAGTASRPGLFLDQKNNLLRWRFSSIGSGDVKKITFETFIADFLTYSEEIRTDFYIKNAGGKIELADPPVRVSAWVFENIVCMGDSFVVLSGYPALLDELLEKEFPHAEFNVVTSGIKGEMANNAMPRFDSDIRIYNPDIIIIGYGANDAGEETGLYRYFMNILVRKAVSTGARVFVYGVGYIDTTISKWKDKANYTVFNDILKNDICPGNGAVYIDLYSEMSKDPEKYLKSDGMHWNEEGTALAVNLILRTLVSHMDKNGKIIK
ncbi:MAG: hypothetical protein FJW66_03600 [Actinobacteria bacterium]|nr:hypothetical protein [Actinomycetota bacterium]